MSKDCEKCKVLKQALITAWSEKAANLNPTITPHQARRIATEHYYDLLGGRETFLNKTKVKA